MFRTAGAVVGGFLGTFIPIPVVGTLFGEIIGEYVGDLTYIHLINGGGLKVDAKMKEDLEGVLKVWVKRISSGLEMVLVDCMKVFLN